MQKFFVTFGCNHPLSDNYVVIEASDESKARVLMFETFGAKWAFIYTEKAFEEAKHHFPGGQVGKTMRTY